MAQRRTVWILGAGFSRALGGPMLSELLTRRSLVSMEALYSDVMLEGGTAQSTSTGTPLFTAAQTKSVYDLFTWGTGRDAAREAPGDDAHFGARMWDHAEAFLDYLDCAARPELTDGTVWNLLNSARGLPMGTETPDPERLTHTARRLVAAQCCAFLKLKPANLEAWEPYIDWAGRLAASDTVITFNYDLVVERAAEYAKQGEGRGIEVLCENVHAQARTATDEGKPVLVKLHGSVDWRLEKNARVVRSGNPEFVVEAGPEEKLAVATPGPTKHDMVRGPLACHWTFAEEALEKADTINLVGYRFPPSDAYSRGRILAALTQAAHQQDAETLLIRIILGPDEAASRRVEELINQATAPLGRKRRVERIPLFAEDYLAVEGLDFFAVHPRLTLEAVRTSSRQPPPAQRPVRPASRRPRRP